ncbi:MULTISPECIES: hypothetical protein [Chromobacterium]|uniref:hypothetical protein n=1 Tax=Chromobacterium TaxID=535 RepID=UPI000D321BE1|nr:MULTISPECIES: hypothetical protein [Chromobacterium]MCP1290571.1 hypothetical protein [Chromobacterium sp. S0633]PTU66071.1 hypothetical protein DB032_14635 [Chromobacterium sp. Panama]UJB30163.1 hypothetical protein HQN78_03290 [Chromobacterium sp. Beijing]
MMQYEHKIFVNQQSGQAQTREPIKDDSQPSQCRKQAGPGKIRQNLKTASAVDRHCIKMDPRLAALPKLAK